MSGMPPLRKQIDEIDRQIIGLLAERFKIVSSVVEVKRAEGLEVRIPARIEEVLQNAVAEARRTGVSERLVHTLWQEIIEETCKAEENILQKAQ